MEPKLIINNLQFKIPLISISLENMVRKKRENACD